MEESKLINDFQAFVSEKNTFNDACATGNLLKVVKDSPNYALSCDVHTSDADQLAELNPAVIIVLG